MEARIARMQAQAAQLTPAELAAHTASMDARLAELEAGRDLSRTWWVLGGVGAQGVVAWRARPGSEAADRRRKETSGRRVHSIWCLSQSIPRCLVLPPLPLPSTRLHVDMDAFYAAVEELDQPALVGAGRWVLVLGVGSCCWGSLPRPRCFTPAPPACAPAPIPHPPPRSMTARLRWAACP